MPILLTQVCPLRLILRVIDFPEAFLESKWLFPNETPCARHLERIRWPEGFEYSSCDLVGNPWPLLEPALWFSNVVTAATNSVSLSGLSCTARNLPELVRDEWAHPNPAKSRSPVLTG